MLITQILSSLKTNILYKQDYVKGRDEGLAEDIIKGKEEGREEGRAEGREEGREEGKATAILQNAKRMKERGIDIETIMKVTGLNYVTISNL